MTDSHGVTDSTGPTLEELAVQFNAFREDSNAEITNLKVEIARLTGRQPAGDAGGTDSTGLPLSTPDPDCAVGASGGGPVSRRGALLALGGAAAGGVGIAIGSGLLGAEPAAATDGNPVELGESGATNSATLATGVTNTGIGHGIVGTSGTGSGIDLFAEVAGVLGDTSQGYGVIGISSDIGGVFGATNADAESGVSGSDFSAGGGIGVSGASAAGYGIHAAGGLAPLVLAPSLGTGAPAGGSHNLGELYLDTNGVFYKCVAEGTPGTWSALNCVTPLPAPVRIVDTTSGGTIGGIAGPLAPGSTLHTTSALTGAHGIPDGAVGLVGNFAISGVGGALLNGYGVATIFPAGATVPTTANINSGAGCFAISNSVTVGLGKGVDAGKLSLIWGGGGPVPDAQAFFDVSGYIV